MLKIRGMSNAETPFTKLCNNWNIPIIFTKDKIIKRIKTTVYILMYNPPIVRMTKVDSDPLGEDMEYIKRTLAAFTRES